MDRINVTKTFLPPQEEYERYLAQIWHNDQLTNQGPLLREFEAQAKQYLNVEHFQFVSNGTISLQLALRDCELRRVVLITGFEFRDAVHQRSITAIE